MSHSQQLEQTPSKIYCCRDMFEGVFIISDIYQEFLLLSILCHCKVSAAERSQMQFEEGTLESETTKSPLLFSDILESK